MRRLCLIGFLLATITVLPVSAQPFGSVDAAGTSYFRFVRPGEASIEVVVLGSASSGVYRLGESVDLSQMIALLGGPGLGPGAPGERRTVTLKLLRVEEGQRQVVFQASLEDVINAPGKAPALQDGDILSIDIEVEAASSFTWRDGMSILTSITGIIVLVERVTRIF